MLFLETYKKIYDHINTYISEKPSKILIYGFWDRNLLSPILTALHESEVKVDIITSDIKKIKGDLKFLKERADVRIYSAINSKFIIIDNKMIFISGDLNKSGDDILGIDIKKPDIVEASKEYFFKIWDASLRVLF